MKVKIEMEVELDPCGATNEEVKEFLEFEFGYNGSMSHNNPLSFGDYNTTDLICEIL